MCKKGNVDMKNVRSFAMLVMLALGLPIVVSAAGEGEYHLTGTTDAGATVSMQFNLPPESAPIWVSSDGKLGIYDTLGHAEVTGLSSGLNGSYSNTHMEIRLYRDKDGRTDSNSIQVCFDTGTAKVIVLFDCTSVVLSEVSASGLNQLISSGASDCCPAQLQIHDRVDNQHSCVPYYSDFLCPPKKTGSIGDTVYCDENGNGEQDGNEPGIPGVTVELVCDNGQRTDAVTDSNGKYLFTGIAEGVACVVTVDPATVPEDKEPSACAGRFDVTLAAGENYLDADFCYKTKVGSIGDTVYCDENKNGVQDNNEPGISGVTVELVCENGERAEAVTDSNGKYLFTGIAGGVACVVTVDPATVPEDKEPGTCAERFDVTLAAGENYLDADFCYSTIVPECLISVKAGCQVKMPLQPATGTDCQGKVIRMVLVYTGDGCEVSDNPQEGKFECVGSPNGQVFSDIIYTGKKPENVGITFDSPAGVGIGEPGTLVIVESLVGNKLEAESILEIQVNGRVAQEVNIHTSCSKDIVVGNQFGSLMLVELTSTENGTVTLLEEDDEVFQSDCTILGGTVGPHCDSKVEVLHLAYVGGDCSFESSQDSSKARCLVDTGVLPETVIIRVSDKRANDRRGKIYLPDTVVTIGDVVTASAATARKKDFKAKTYVAFFDVNTGALLREVEFHTSCSQPLNLGNLFGGLRVVGIDTKDSPLATLGTEVIFSYEITNDGADAVTITDVIDVFGVLEVAPFELSAGESIVFKRETLLSDAVSNRVLVEANGGDCSASDESIIELAEVPESCGPCKGGVTQLTLMYLGDNDDAPDLVQLFNNNQLVAEQVMNAGDEITVAGSRSDGKFEKNDLLLFVDGSEQNRIHVSCSQPVNPGLVYGPFQIIEAYSRENGLICP